VEINFEYDNIVSNPWREAIEEKSLLKYFAAWNGFQSLEGGY